MGNTNNANFESWVPGVEDQNQWRLPGAIEEYDEVLHYESQLAYAYYERGTAYFNLGEYQRAIEDYGRAERLDPEFAFPCADRAIAYTLLGKDKEAQQDVDRAVGLGFGRGELDCEIEEIKRQR